MTIEKQSENQRKSAESILVKMSAEDIRNLKGVREVLTEAVRDGIDFQAHASQVQEILGRQEPRAVELKTAVGLMASLSKISTKYKDNRVYETLQKTLNYLGTMCR